MGLYVQKYGGSSLGDSERIKAVAKRIQEYYNKGEQMVIVVSARGGITNELLDRAKSITPNPSARELDILLACGEQESMALMTMALQQIGIPAVSMTVVQAGIQTNNQHNHAQITDIKSKSILEAVNKDQIVVLPGFQGISPCGDITTLGRGGSDLTAVAIAHAIKADICQIYTDVDGVYTADPFLIPHAQKIERLCYEEMLELSKSGCKVMQYQAVQYAQAHNIEFEIRSSFNHHSGTHIGQVNPQAVSICSIALDQDLEAIHLECSQPACHLVQTLLRQKNITAHLVIENKPKQLHNCFIVAKWEAKTAQRCIQDALLFLEAGHILSIEPLAKVSVVGLNIEHNAYFLDNCIQYYHQEGISIQSIQPSKHSLSIFVPQTQGQKATHIMHQVQMSLQPIPSVTA